MQSQIILNGIPPQDFWDTIRAIVTDAVATIQPTEKVKPFLSIREASDFTGLSVSTLYRLTSEKQIPHIKQGGKLLFATDKLSAWLNESQQPVKH